MGRSISLTIRIDEDLKKDAEIACAHMERTLSSFIRSCLKDCVSSFHKVKVRDGGYYKAFMETESAQEAYAFLKAEIQKRPDGLQVPAKQEPEYTHIPVARNESISSTKAIIKTKPDIKVDSDGKLDPATMPRKMRREYERELAKGTLNVKPSNKQQTKPTLERFNPEERLRELLAKEKRGHLTRQERNQKNSLLRVEVLHK